MNAWTRQVISGFVIVLTLVSRVFPASMADAAEPNKQGGATLLTPSATNDIIITVVNDCTVGAERDQFEYVGDWTHDLSSPAIANCYNGDGTYSKVDGSYLRVKFFGTRIRLFGCLAPHHGVGMVSVDGGMESEADFRAPAYKYKVMVYESPTLSCAEHVLKLRVHQGYCTPDYVEVDSPRLRPGKVEILGYDCMLIPKAGSAPMRYSSRVSNTSGIMMPGEPVAWSLHSPVQGVGLDTGAGCVMVSNTAVVGSAFTLVARAESVLGTKRIALLAPTLTQTLTTEDSSLTLCVVGNRIFITALKNPQHGWDWVAGSSTAVVPLPPTVSGKAVNYVGRLPPTVSGKAVNWDYVGHSLDTTNGTVLTLTFVSKSPNLELRSVWRARHGVGPVEHQMAVVNRTEDSIIFNGNDIEAVNLDLTADNPVLFFPTDAAVVGFGEGTPLPYQIVKVGSAHGIYFAYDYGCGQYQATRDAANPLRINCRFWIGNNVLTTIAAGETYKLPGIMIQAYKGDEDDAANHFREWFWNYEITPSLKNNTNEPPIQICNEAGDDGKPDLLVNQAKTPNFASWGAGCFKTDAWHWDTGHARSDELATALHAQGVKLSLYFNGQVPEKVLLDEAAKSHFDYYRSDDYGRGPPFDLRDYHSVENFKRKLEALAKVGVGWENCCNGGNLRSLDICRRMTFMTHSDTSGLKPFFVHVYNWSYMMPPIQLKSDYAVAADNTADIRGYLLGSILGSSPINAGFVGSFDKVKNIYALYNTKQRAILRGADVYRILPPPADKQWFGLQYYNTFINKGSVLLWQNGGPASQVIKLKGLDRGATYKLAFEDATEKNGSLTGAQLMDEGMSVPMGTNASEIIWINCDVTVGRTRRLIR